MALVSGQSFFPSAAELDTSPNSDDEYDYVSSLAEQIAHAMLDEDEPSEEESHGFRLDPPALVHHYSRDPLNVFISEFYMSSDNWTSS